MIAAAWICLVSPLAAALAITLGGMRIPRRAAGWIATVSTTVSFTAALVALIGLVGEDSTQRYHLSTAWTWLGAGSFHVGLTILLDPLSVFMMLVVSGVGTLIVAYSIGYMEGEDEERRYFAYMALFVFSMLLLVQGGNLLMLLVGWGLVGLSSYLLIGFYQEKPSAVAAAKKAFIMNAFGDATMALALFLLIQHTGTLELRRAASDRALEQHRHRSRRARPARRRDRESRRSCRCRRGCRTRWRVRRRCQRVDPRGDDGDGGRVPDRAVAPLFVLTPTGR